MLWPSADVEPILQITDTPSIFLAAPCPPLLSRNRTAIPSQAQGFPSLLCVWTVTVIRALKVCSVPQDLGDSVTRELAEMLPHELLPPPQVVRERCGRAEVPRIHRDKVLVHAHGLRAAPFLLQDMRECVTRGAWKQRCQALAAQTWTSEDAGMKGGMRARSFLGIIQARLSLWDP